MGKIDTFQTGGAKVASAGKTAGLRNAAKKFDIAGELSKREVPVFIEAQNKRAA